MIWFWVVVLVVIIGVAAVVAAGRGDAMADVYEDRPDVTLGRGHPLAAADVAKVRFTTAVRGYRMDEVDAFVARIEADLRARDGASADETATSASADETATSASAAAPGSTPPAAGTEPADDRLTDDDHAADQSPAEHLAEVSAVPSTKGQPGRRRGRTQPDAGDSGWRRIGGRRRADHGVDAAPEASTDGDDADTSR